METAKNHHKLEEIQKRLLEIASGDLAEPAFIRLLEGVVADYGAIACSTILQHYGGIVLDDYQAVKVWEQILEHRKKMSTGLGYQAGLLTAICDFRSRNEGNPNSLKIIGVRQLEDIIEDTIHDDLTGIFKKNYFLKLLEQQVSSAERYLTELSVLFMDIDYFKDVNDSFGHQAGDKALKTIVSVVEEEIRDSDVFARYGGEEFILLMPHTSNLNALILAERIRKKIAQTKIVYGNKEFYVTISGGVASFPGNGKTPEEVVQSADSALYQAKGAGRDTIEQFRKDNRRYLRVKLSKEVRIKELGFNNSAEYSGVSKDIGAGGILFENRSPLPIGMRIQLSVSVQGKDPLLLIGRVVRVEVFSETSCDIGMEISFKEMDKIAHSEIAGFLKRERMIRGR